MEIYNWFHMDLQLPMQSEVYLPFHISIRSFFLTCIKINTFNTEFYYTFYLNLLLAKQRYDIFNIFSHNFVPSTLFYYTRNEKTKDFMFVPWKTGILCYP